MKTVILGLDGLDHYIVTSEKLQYLLQQQNGQIEVPINEKQGVPVSPEVWASFLTGQIIKNFGFRRSGCVGHVIEWLLRLRGKKSLPSWITKSYLGQRIGRKAPRKFPDLKIPTFLDFKGTAEINAPYFSYDHRVIAQIQKLINTDKDIILNQLREILNSRIRNIEEKIQQLLPNYKVVFAYMHYPDCIQHLEWHNYKEEIIPLYNRLNNFTKKISEDIMHNNRLVILSDHGFDFNVGTHSKWGSFSTNKPILPQPESIVDFFHLVKKWL